MLPKVDSGMNLARDRTWMGSLKTSTLHIRIMIHVIVKSIALCGPSLPSNVLANFEEVAARAEEAIATIKRTISAKVGEYFLRFAKNIRMLQMI
jgi:hypothetical protein